MIVGSCIKYTAAGGEGGSTYSLDVGGWGGQSLSAVCKESSECLGAQAGCETCNGHRAGVVLTGPDKLRPLSV